MPRATLMLALLLAAAACGLDTSGTAQLDGDGGGGSYAGGDGATSGSGSGAGSGSGSGSGSGASTGSSGAQGTGDDGGPADATTLTGEGAVPGTCDFNGTWASRLTINVTWAPQGLNSIILAPGSGKIRQWIRGDRVVHGTSAADATVVCGIELPDFQSTALAATETYGVVFPGTLFDGNYLPTFTASGTLSGQTPGSTYKTTPSAALLGITLTNPTTDAWPMTVTTSSDMDKDGKPGVTANVATGASAQGTAYSGVPVGIPAPFTPTVRASRLYVAIRQVTVASGTATDCTHIRGTVTIPTIAANSKVGIDSHVIGCELAAGGDCSATQANFVDNTQPVFTPTGTGTLESMRVPTGSSCASVRQMLP
jgi:hypothetical protein